MPRKSRSLLWALAVILVLALVGLLVRSLNSPPSRAPLPNPNGYDDFVQAAARSIGDAANASTLDHDGLRELVAANAEALRLVHLGLTRQCCVPTAEVVPNLQPGLLTAMKRLAQLLAAEGRLHELDNQPGAAARRYGEIIRLGNEMSRGGTLIYRLVGIACEAIGCQAMAKVLPKLDREDGFKILGELGKIETNRVSWREIWRNEDYFTRYQLRRTLNPIHWVTAWRQTQEQMTGAEARHKAIIAHERLLAGELALRLFQRDHGRVPARPEDLVPDYLASVPQDPFTGRPLIYRPQSTNWLLYSVGPDGLDHGGKPAPRWGPGKGDILFDRF